MEELLKLLALIGMQNASPEGKSENAARIIELTQDARRSLLELEQATAKLDETESCDSMIAIVEAYEKVAAIGPELATRIHNLHTQHILSAPQHKEHRDMMGGRRDFDGRFH